MNVSQKKKKTNAFMHVSVQKKRQEVKVLDK